MSTLAITNAGLNYKDAVFAGSEVQNITHFVFANIDGLQETDPIDPDVTIPTADVVHTQPVELISQLNDNAVVMSAAMGYNVGPFDFNWYGAVATLADNSEALIAVVHTNSQSKTATSGPSVGNYMVKSIVWRSSGIANDLNVTVSALPWQANHEEFVSKAEFNAHNHNELYATKAENAATLAKATDKHIFSAINQNISAYTEDKITIQRYSEDDATITVGTPAHKGQEIHIYNSLETSGTITLIGPPMYTPNGSSSTSHTFTGKGTIKLIAHDTVGWVITEISR